MNEINNFQVFEIPEDVLYEIFDDTLDLTEKVVTSVS